MPPKAVTIAALAGITAVAMAIGSDAVQSAAAGALLHPTVKPMLAAPPAGCEATTFEGFHATLSAWRCRPAASPRATVVPLHRVAHHRASWRAPIQRVTPPRFATIPHHS